jgi:hypothetical protein
MPDDFIMTGEILPDGTIAFTTGTVGPTHHESAEEFLEQMLKMNGGKGAKWKVTERTEKPFGHTHTHGEHQHEH